MLLVGGAGVIAAAAMSPTPPDSADELIGRCFRLDDAGSVTETVDCDEPNDGRACPPTYDGIIVFERFGEAVDGVVCIESNPSS